MATKHYDAIVVGAGQAGVPLARQLAQQGRKTALIEKYKLGGSCVNYGCTPTKTLVASARAAYIARHAADWGVNVPEVSIDFAKVMQRKTQRVEASRGGIEESLARLDNLDVIYAAAEFSNSKQLHVDADTLEAPQIFLNVGQRARIPDIEGLQEVDYLTNKDILHLESLPQRLLIMGGSYIGLEFGQMFRRFGAEVVIFEQGERLISREDPDLSQQIADFLAAEGVELHLQTRVSKVSQQGDKITLHYQGPDGETHTRSGSHLLVAVGRVSNADTLNPAAAGLALGKHGSIQVDERLQTNVPGIFALGDVNGEGAFTHSSYNDYEIMHNILFGDDSRRLTDRITTYALYTDPPLGRVGMTLAQAKDSGKKVLVAAKPMDEIGRNLERGTTRGLMRFLVDEASGHFLGAAILGHSGDEIVHSITNLMYAKAPYTVVRDSVGIHPTISELIPTTLHELAPLD